MKILLIDNHSKHKEELVQLLGEHATIETQDQLKDSDANSYDLIVLSGGSNIPSAFHHPDAYAKEIAFVQHTKTPVLGICLGNEIIVQSFGGTLQDFGSIHRGNVVLSITDENLENALGQNSLQVYEAHEIGIQDMPSDFLSYAHSDHGIEIIKHKTRPIVGIQFHPEVTPNKQFIGWVMKNLGF